MEKEGLRDKIKKMRSTPRGRAFFKLIVWAIFFFLLFVALIVMSIIGPIKVEKDEINQNENNAVPEETIVEKDFDYYWNLFITGDYDYKYEIVINDSKYIFDGAIVNNINTGYKETSLGIIKYYIDETGIYQDVAGDKILIDNLYDGLNVDYFSLEGLLNLIRSLNPIEDNTCDCVYPVYAVDREDSKYLVSFVSEDEVDFAISFLDSSYNVQYTRVK